LKTRSFAHENAPRPHRSALVSQGAGRDFLFVESAVFAKKARGNMSTIVNCNNFEFVGWWRFPRNVSGHSTAYSWGGMTLRIGPGGQRWVYKVGHPQYGSPIFQVVAPDLDRLTLDLSQAPYADFVQDFDITPYLDADSVDVRRWCINNEHGGALEYGSGGQWPFTRGLYWDEQARLLRWTSEIWYHVQATQNVNAGATFMDSSPPMLHGPGWICQNQATGNILGGWLLTPASFSETGAKWLFGWGGFWAVGSAGSRGPGLYVVDQLPSDDQRVYEARAILHFYGYDALDETIRDQHYSVDDSMGWAHRPPDGTRGYWVGTDSVQSCVWLDTPELRGVIFTGNIGQGLCHYPAGQGPTAEGGWLTHFYVYDPVDLANSYSDPVTYPVNAIAPVSYWPIAELPDNPGFRGAFQGRTHGAFLETPGDGHVYLHQLDNYADYNGYEQYPAVAVYKILVR